MIECPACGFSNIPGTDTCEQCHSPLTDTDSLGTRAHLFARALRDAPVTALASSKPVFVKADEDVHDVIRKLNDASASAALVTDDAGELIGIITERDILYNVRPRHDDAAEPTPVSSIMVTSLHTLKEQDSVSVLLNTLAVYGHRRVPVCLDEGYSMIDVRQLFDYLMALKIS